MIAATITVHATAMTEGADDATTTTMTVTVVGRRTRGARELLSWACGM
jgi:hypothetical protein